MTPERYRKAGEIYHAALAVPRAARADFLVRACASDDDLRHEVESLLAAHDSAGQFIEAPPQHLSSLMPSPVDSLSNPGSVSPARHQELPAAESTESLLVPGQRLGRYEVLSVLGSGGMGTVYRAVDASLGREVAIKALAAIFRRDSASLRRFEREARVLATLSHPNIASIYGIERLEDSLYLVLERVDGETLADRLDRGAMAVHDAADIAAQIVAGLEEAHGKGVIHRDLKPSNVMLTADSRVKLVDFGLAKPAQATGAVDLSAEPITAAGVVLGTARYMSPEQIKGEHVDVRTDVWALGCVLYEMLTARPAFAGRSVSEVVAAVLRDDPDWDVLPAETPRNLRRLLRRCLRRDVRTRLHHVGDARLELLEADDEGQAAMPGHAIAMRRTRIAVAVAVTVGLGVLAALSLPRNLDDRTPMHLSLELPAGLTLGSEFSAPYAIAPTGSPVVVEAEESGTSRLYVRELTGAAVRVLAGTEGARQPFISPDGAWVGFFANRKLAKVPVSGGPVLQVADVGGNPRGAAWAPDGTIVFAAPQTAGLWRVSESGGKPSSLTTLDKARGEASHRWPDVLPGGRWVLFTVGFEDASYDEARIDAVSLETGERRIVLAGAGFARYLPEGRLLFVRGGNIHSVGFDPERLQTRGAPEVALDPVRYDVRNGGSHLAVSASGVLVYGPGTPLSSDNYLVWVDRKGGVTRAADTPRLFRHIKASPDGHRIAAVIGSSTDSDLWLLDGNGTLSQLSFGLSPHRPTWTPDGDGITVAAEKNGTWQLLTLGADGKANPTVLFQSSHRLYPNAWSPDGRYLIFQESRPDTGWDLQVLEVNASGHPVGDAKPFANTPFHETTAAMSHDGRWVAYESDEVDGVYDVYVRSFPDAGHKLRVSSGGTRGPAWDTQGNLHYWQTPDDNVPRAVQTTEKDGQLSIGTPQPVWRGSGADGPDRILNPAAGARYDLEPTGARFLVLESVASGPGPGLSHPMIVIGWRPAGAGSTR